MRVANVVRGVAGALFVLAATILPARATTLLDLVNDSGDRPYSFAVVASSSSTLFSFAGYDVPSFTNAQNVSLMLNGSGPNLFSFPWTYTPAPLGALASQGAGSFSFGGLSTGSYDIFSQAVATTIGASYTLSFDYVGGSASSGFRVETDAVTGVPEPSTWALMILGFAGIGFVAYRKSGGRRLRLA